MNKTFQNVSTVAGSTTMNKDVLMGGALQAKLVQPTIDSSIANVINKSGVQHTVTSKQLEPNTTMYSINRQASAT